MKKHLLLVLTVCMAGLTATAHPRSASQPIKLIESQTGLMAPVWSPTGDKIAVTTDNYKGILVANADGSAIKTVTTANGAGYKMAWSSDGKQIMGRVNQLQGTFVKHEMKAWSVADGKVSAVKTRMGLPAWKETNSAYDIMINDPAGACGKIASLKEYAGAIVINPALSADGSKVAFQIPGKGVMVMNSDGSDLRAICKGSHPQWLPDGKTLIISRVQDNGSQFTASDLYSVDIENRSEVLLTGSTDMIPLTPAVSPDGKKVAFENAADAAIYIINLNY